MKNKLGTTFFLKLICLTFIIQLNFLTSFANPPYENQNHGRHDRRQQPPPLCVTDPHNHQDSPAVPDFTKNQPVPNFQNSKPGKPGINIFPDVPQLQQNSNDESPSSPPGSSGIQIFPPGMEPGEAGPKPLQPQESTCPGGSGLFKKTGLCYKFASKTLAVEDVSPCSSLMEFYKINSNPMYGECECKAQHLGVSRPIVYWEKSDQCFWLFDQGPCEGDEWLILNDHDIAICSKRSCPENTLEDTPEKYWFRHRGKCYKSGEKGFCEDPQHNAYLVLKDQRYIADCKQFQSEVKTLLNGAKPLPCLPGHKESATGECRQSAKFE